MSFSRRDWKHLDAMRLVESVSRSLKTISWIWGGFTTDVYAGRILREHDDLDHLTSNLHRSKSEFVEAFSSHGWQTEHLVNGDLRLKKDGIKVHLGNVEVGEVARWTHNGEQGSLLFPASWLNPKVVVFCGIELHVITPELQYVLKAHPGLLNPHRKSRDQDILEKERLRNGYLFIAYVGYEYIVHSLSRRIIGRNRSLQRSL